MPIPTYRIERYVELTKETSIRVDGYAYIPTFEEWGQDWEGFRIGPTYTLVGFKYEHPHLPEEVALDLMADELGATGEGAERTKNTRKLLDELVLEEVTERHQDRVMDGPPGRDDYFTDCA